MEQQKSVQDVLQEQVGTTNSLLSKINDKTVSGFAAGVIVSIIVVKLINQTMNPIILYLGAISAMLIEIIPLRINDNFIIPNFAAIIMLFLTIKT